MSANFLLKLSISLLFLSDTTNIEALAKKHHHIKKHHHTSHNKTKSQKEIKQQKDKKQKKDRKKLQLISKEEREKAQSFEFLDRLLKKGEARCLFNVHRLFDSRADKIFEKVMDGSNKYEDPLFPADDTSLFWVTKYNYTTQKTGDLIASYRKKVDRWARPSELQGLTVLQPELWGLHGISPTGIAQGILGDNWILSAAAALAEKPERIQRIFRNSDYPKNGIFQLQFFIKGEPVNVVIDDLLPVTPGEYYVNARPIKDSGAFWAVILEKAFAKVFINYSNLNGGLAPEALRVLTGAPVLLQNSNRQTDKEIWESIDEYAKLEYAMTAGCQHSLYDLVEGHYYTVIRAVTFTDSKDEKNKINLIQLRSPWISERYTGPWSNEDPNWTTEGLISARQGGNDPTIFHMTVQDFRTAFPSYEVAMISDKWKKTTLPSEGSRGKQWDFMFKNDAKQDFVLGLDYLSNRLIPDGCHKPDVMYNIYLRDQEGQIIQQKAVSTKLAYGQVFVKNLEPGIYNFKVINWKDASVKSDFTLTGYAQNNPVVLKTAADFLLEEIITADPTKVKVIEDVKTGVISKSFYDLDKRSLTVFVEKPASDDLISTNLVLKFLTLNGFPWHSLQSNYDWYKDVKAKVAQEDRLKRSKPISRYYEVKLVCPKTEQICVYKIPDVVKFKGVKLM